MRATSFLTVRLLKEINLDRTVIPSGVKAQVSIRIVPDQELSQIASSLEEHVRTSFKRLQSPNTLNVGLDARIITDN